MTFTPLLRELFPVTLTHTYLNHAAVGVPPRPTADAIHAFIDAQATAGIVGVVQHELRMPQYRERIGRFIGGTGEEIAILRNTTDGITTLARGIDWQPGDEIIISDNEFPATASERRQQVSHESART